MRDAAASNDAARARAGLSEAQPTGRRLVWDLPLRLFHWLLVLSVAGSWLTAEIGFEWMQVHIYFGYLALSLLLFRLGWGIVGPRHARFASFVRGPREVIRYVRGTVSGEAAHSVGHNPLGALMVLAMLVLLAFQAASGLFAYDDILYAGPYNGAVDSDLGERLTGLHKKNFKVLIVSAIVLHVVAIAWYWLRKGQNLTAAMITGRKPAGEVPAGQAIESSHLLRAALVASLSALAVWLLVALAPPPADISYF